MWHMYCQRFYLIIVSNSVTLFLIPWLDEEVEEEVAAPDSPVDVKDNIKQKFLVEMPDNFYHFWDFCKRENKSSPCG